MLHFIPSQIRQSLAAGLALLALCASASALSPQPVDPGGEIAQPSGPADDPLNDVRITVAVRQILTKDPRLAETYIDVDTLRAIVTLRGRVRELSQRELASRLVLSAFGVRQVDNQLSVTRALL
jgi:osmotically-inducible protein OsmY